MAVYGNAAYGAGELLQVRDAGGAQIMCKVQPPVAPAGRLAKDRFTVDLTAGKVRCPAGINTAIRPADAGGGTARFGAACASCPLAARCNTANTGWPHDQRRALGIAPAAGPGGAAGPGLAAGLSGDPLEHGTQDRAPDAAPAQRPAGRVRGKAKVTAEFSLLAATVNVARLAALNLVSTPQGSWTVATT